VWLRGDAQGAGCSGTDLSEPGVRKQGVDVQWGASVARAHEYPVEGGAGGGRQLVEEVVGPRRHAHVTHQLRQLAIERPPAQIR
jgi:hypothetical protein